MGLLKRTLLSGLLGSVVMPTFAASASVAIDVGHSLARPGATAASGASEFSLNKALAIQVDGQLKRQGLTTQLVGLDGSANSLTGRTSMASGAAFFVSLHHDSVKQEWESRVREFSGYAVFVSRKNVDPKGSLACARLIARQLQNAGFAPSRYHALPVPGEGRPFADESLGIHWFDDLVVLKTAKQPAVLIESGVIVNPDDEARVTSQDGRARLSVAIGRGISSCFR